jgi:hypothetical protein
MNKTTSDQAIPRAVRGFIFSPIKPLRQRRLSQSRNAMPASDSPESISKAEFFWSVSTNIQL